MKPIIIPAVLTSNLGVLQEKIKLISSFSSNIQLDISDGVFVNNKTISLKDIINKKIYFKNLFLEIHLMVKNPQDYFLDCQKIGAKRVIFHYEAFKKIDDLFETVSYGKKINFEIGVAINPSTSINILENLINKIDFFLFMSVNPGWQGQEFIPKVLEKIKKFKKKYPEKKVEIDGGVNDKNIKKIVQSGVDFIVVGSYIVKSQNPKESFFYLQKISKWFT